MKRVGQSSGREQVAKLQGQHLGGVSGNRRGKRRRELELLESGMAPEAAPQTFTVECAMAGLGWKQAPETGYGAGSPSAGGVGAESS